jgi:6-phospho-beta-glucosidase
VVDGQDRLPDLLATSADTLAQRSGLPTELLRRLGVWPSSYLRYFYEHDHVVEQQRAKSSRAEEVAEIERRLLEIYADTAVDEKPDLLQRRGGAYYSEAAVNLMASLITDQGDLQVINMRNQGTLPFLADDAVIEIPSRIGRAGVAPLPVAAVDPLYAGLIAHVSAYEELALDAAIHGGRERVFRALLAHPLIGQHDLADKLTDLLINANRDHLRWAA